jgi:hypothetical protein
MILAAAEYGETPNGDPPPGLSLALSCRRWNSLPEAGGLLDQPAGLLRRLSIVENVYNCFRALKESNDLADFGNKHPEQVALIESVIRMREQHGKDNPMSTTGGEHGR